MRDLASRLAASVLIPAAVYAATPSAPSLDLTGFEGALVLLSVGVGGITFTGSNKIDFVMTHSDDGNTWLNVADADISGVTGTANGIVRTLNAAKPAADVTKIGYMGGKRFVRVTPTFSGTHGTGTPISAELVKSNARYVPAA